jgi:glycosidase
LYNFYKKIIHLRQTHEALANGNYQTLQNNNDHVLSFLRYQKDKAVIVIINLSNADQQAYIDLAESKIKLQKPKQLYGNAKANTSSNTLSVNTPAYGITLWETR